MSLVFGSFRILLVTYLFATLGIHATSGNRQDNNPATMSSVATTLTTTTVQQQTDTIDYRTISVTTSSIYDYNISLSRFRICLNNVENMNLTFQVKSCHDARIALFTELGLDGPMYEIVIGGRNNRSYIQQKTTVGMYLVLKVQNVSDEIFVSCNKFHQFSILWESNNISLETGYDNRKRILQAPYKLDTSSLKYATVMTGFGATGEWTFKLKDKESACTNQTCGSLLSWVLRSFMSCDVDNIPDKSYIISMEILNERSNNICRLGVSYGFNTTKIWVHHGCWALFKVCYLELTTLSKPVKMVGSKTTMLCPSVAECYPELSSDGYTLVKGIGPDCEKNGSQYSIYLKFNSSALCGTACTTEFIQLTGCISTGQQDCRTCNITDYTFDATSLRPYIKAGQNKVHVMDVSTPCDSLRNWTMYFRFVHYKSTNYGYRTINVTTLPLYDYYMSLSRFRICLKSVENIKLTFYVKSCHDARVALLSEQGLDGPMYEIVFDNKHAYIQEKEPDGHIISNTTDKIFYDCGGFSKFWISWGNNHITLGNTNKRLKMDIRDRISLLHATVTSGVGASGAEWQFVFRDSGMLQPVIFKTETEEKEILMLCPLVEECDLNMEKTSSCDPIISDIDIVCNGSKVYLNVNCNTGDIDQACTTEFIQITECVSTKQQGCKTCHITNVTFDAAPLCLNGNLSMNTFEVIDVHRCDFFRMYGWNSYLRYVHFKSEDQAITTGDSTTTTLTMAATTTPMTTKSTTTTPMTTTTTTTTPMTTTTTTTTRTSSNTHPATTTVKSTTVNIFAESEQKSNTPLTIGIAVGATGLLLAVICAVVLLLFIKRSRIAEHKQSSTIIVSKGDDYTGNQSIALPSGGHIPNSEKYTDIQLEIEEQNYQELTTISKSENEVAYDYIDTSDVKRKSAPKADKGSQKPEYVKQVEDLPDYPPTTDGNNYSVLDPDETGSNRSRELPKIETETDASSAYAVLDPTVTGFDRSAIPPVQPVETYAILDPRETGFNRLEKAVPSDYAMAKPLTDDKIGDISEQPYCRDYNELGDSVLKQVEENVYSHSVDNVYDCASHNSKSKGSDGTYDNFVGQ